MYGNDDSDMKIVGSFQTGTEVQDESEAAARLYERERSNGNLERAHGVGRFFAAQLLTPGGIAYGDEADFKQRNISVLYAFAADQAMNLYSPNALIAQSAENEFYDEIRRSSLTLYESISRSGAFSIYLLCRREKDGRRSGIGEAFAKILRRENDPETIKTGEECYKKFCDFCFEHLKKIDFSL